MRLPDGHRLNTVSCRIRMKWPSGRRTPLYLSCSNLQLSLCILKKIIFQFQNYFRWKSTFYSLLSILIQEVSWFGQAWFENDRLLVRWFYFRSVIDQNLIIMRSQDDHIHVNSRNSKKRTRYIVRTNQIKFMVFSIFLPVRSKQNWIESNYRSGWKWLHVPSSFSFPGYNFSFY